MVDLITTPQRIKNTHPWGYLTEYTIWCDKLLNSLRPSDAYMLQWANHHWFSSWLVAWSAPSHYLNQCWNIANWTIKDYIQWNRNQSSYIFTSENAFENVVYETAAILSRPQCVKMVGINYPVMVSQRILSKVIKRKNLGDSRWISDFH